MQTSTRFQKRKLKRENRLWPDALKLVSKDEWPQSIPVGLIEAWRSRNFFVQVYGDDWAAEITWDELQQLKRECGRGDMWAVEIYPHDFEIVNVANMRHLWLLPKAPDFTWRKRDALSEKRG